MENKNAFQELEVPENIEEIFNDDDKNQSIYSGQTSLQFADEDKINVFRQDLNVPEIKKCTHFFDIGQIQTKYPDSNKIFMGTGTLLCMEEDDSEIYYVLTCAHNFVRRNTFKNEYIFADQAVFFLGRNSKNDYRDKLYLTKFRIFDDYLKGHHDPIEGCDLAIAMFQKGVVPKLHNETKNIQWPNQQDYSEFKQDELDGKRIQLVGYPFLQGYQNNQVYKLGQVSQVWKSDKTGNDILLYNEVGYHGMSGGPLFTNGKDYLWSLIGIHNANHQESSQDIATYLNQQKFDWIKESIVQMDQ